MYYYWLNNGRLYRRVTDTPSAKYHIYIYFEVLRMCMFLLPAPVDDVFADIKTSFMILYNNMCLTFQHAPSMETYCIAIENKKERQEDKSIPPAICVNACMRLLQFIDILDICNNESIDTWSVRPINLGWCTYAILQTNDAHRSSFISAKQTNVTNQLGRKI